MLYTVVIGRDITQSRSYVLCCHYGALLGYLLSSADWSRYDETLITWQYIELTSTKWPSHAYDTHQQYSRSTPQSFHRLFVYS